MSRKRLMKNLSAGAIAGAVGSLAMDRFQALASRLEQNGAGGGSSGSEPATVKAAEAISEKAFHHRLSGEEKKWAGPAMHYAMGTGSGVVYGLIAEAMPAITAATGVVFGTLLWAIADEGAVPALGLSKSALEYPPVVHLKALSSHMVYGITAELVRRAVMRIL